MHPEERAAVADDGRSEEVRRLAAENARLLDEARAADALRRIGLAVAAELDLHKVVQLVTDEATALTGAQFGAFFYNVLDAEGESYTLYTLSGAPRSAFDRFPMPRNTAVFATTFTGEAVVRLADVTADPRYGQNAPYRGMPPGHLPVRSYLAVPVKSRTGEVLGGLFFGHSSVGVFTDRHERLAVGVAAQASVAIDNARLFAARRAAEDRLRMMVEAATDYAIFAVDPDGVVATWNTGAERLFGWPEAEIVGRPGDVLFTPEDRAAGVPARELATAADRGRAEDERWHVRRDGTRFYASGVVTPIRNGGLRGFTKIARDVTARWRADQRLAAQLHLTGILAAARSLDEAARELVGPVWEQLGFDAGGLWSVDDRAGALRRVCGWAAPDLDAAAFEAASAAAAFAPGVGLPGRVWRDGRAAWVRDVTADDNFFRRDEAAAAGLRAGVCVPVRSGEAVLGVLEFFAREARDPDDELLGWMAVIGGQVGQFVDRVRTREALRRGEERFRLALASGAVTAFEQDADLRYTWVYPQDPAFGPGNIGHTDADLLPPDEAAELTRLKRRVLETGERARKVVRATVPGGARYYDLQVEPLREDGGRVVGVCGAALDVTDRERVEAALRDADRRKDEFLAVLAHELRNPLAPIRNALEIIRLRGDAPTIVGRAREMMDRQLTHLTRLVDDLLDVSRIARGKVVLRRERVDLADVVRAAVETSGPHIEAAGHHLAVDGPDAPLVVDGDPVRLAQVLTNLLNNAARYTPDGGRVQLVVVREGGAAVVRVRDTGVGLPDDLRPRLFEPFAQAPQSADRSPGGLGLGLALVRGLVELHGGSVEAHSDGPGTGSEFVVRLPLAGVA